jgi:hypothetical protein
MMQIDFLCRQYSKEYVQLEEQARAAHKGIWAGTFEVPSKWRRARKRDAVIAQTQPAPASSLTQSARSHNGKF